MNYKRLTILCGHYGSGKTNIAVNMALDLKKQYEKTVIADLDIVNPYFRTKDSLNILSANGIKLVCSEFANSNVDVPALPADLYSITDDTSKKVILDIGGDDRGAYVLGRLAELIKAENDYEMVMVINKYRPLTPNVEATLEVMHEIEAASHIAFTAVINNSNLGSETARETILNSLEYANGVANAAGLKLLATTVEKSIAEKLDIDGIFPLTLQKRPIEI